MTRRLLLTFSAAAWLTGMYLMYARYVSPVIEPKLLEQREPQFVASNNGAEEIRPGEYHQVASEFLPDQDWAKDAENRFRIGDMFLYTNKVEQQENKAEVRFTPFALVWKNPRGKQSEVPLRVTADAAVIQFESAFDLSNPQPGRPVFGRLEGEVHIDGPNSLQIVGRGFTFSEQALRLWSDSDILFRYGPHHGTGHGLQVDFLPGSDAVAATPDQPRLGGLRSVSLLQQVVLNLEGEDVAGDAPRRSPLKADDKLKVESDGRMQYDLEANLITFDHNVRVRHPVAAPLEEGINCDLLTLVLLDPAKTSAAPGQNPSATGKPIALASNEDAGPAGGMQGWLPETLNLEKLLADGNGKRRVQLFSQPREVECYATQVEYDLPKRVVTMRDPGTVDVRQAAQEIHAPEITLAFHENQRDIKQAVARGAGSASSKLNDGRVVSAKWKKQLVKLLDPETQLDIVEVQGDASIKMEPDYELSGDAVRMWVTPLAMVQKPPVGARTARRGPQTRQGNPPPRVERVAGVGNVVMKSPEATAHTNWLDVRFQPVDLPADAAGSGQLFGLNTGGEAPRSGNGQRGQPPRAADGAPLDLQAKSIRALVSRDNSDPSRMALSDLWANEAVTVTQPMKPGEPPLMMLGQTLHVASPTPVQQLVTLTGVPAQIKSGIARLEGNDIRLDRQKNTLDVLGAGALQYPVNMSLDGQPLEHPEPLQVKWAEKLTFDGKQADFFEKVEASLKQSVMRCNALHVTLANPIRFDDPQLRKLSPQQMQVARIFCENRVEIDAAEYQNNIIISRSFGRLGQFVVDNVTGKTEALGPGYFMEWRRGQRTSDNRLNAKKVAKPIAQSEPKHEWTYSRIDFQGLMKGNVRDRFTTFQDHVEVVYGPVPHATDKIEPDELPEGAAAITCDALRVEQFAETESAPAFIKLSAEGNTRLELEWVGQPWHAQADEVKFDESKDYYVLRSIGNQKVIVNRQPTTDDPRGRIKCSRVDIFRSKREIKVHNAIELNGLQN